MIDLFYMTTKGKMLFMVKSSVSLLADRFISHELKSKMLFMVTSSVPLSADRFILHDNEKQNVVHGDIICASVS